MPANLKCLAAVAKAASLGFCAANAFLANSSHLLACLFASKHRAIPAGFNKS
jgi:hypothetical protein